MTKANQFYDQGDIEKFKLAVPDSFGHNQAIYQIQKDDPFRVYKQQLYGSRSHRGTSGLSDRARAAEAAAPAETLDCSLE